MKKMTETQFKIEIFNILNSMYENIFQTRAIFQSGPFTVNPHSCAILGENIFINKPIILCPEINRNLP